MTAKGRDRVAAALADAGDRRGGDRAQIALATQSRQCHVCEAPLGDGESKKFQAHFFHMKCWHAVRCYRRIAAKEGRGRVDRCDDLMDTKPDAWRSLVAPLVKGDTNRSSAARRSIQRTIHEQEQYQRHEHISDKTVMNRRRFRKWSFDNDGCGSETADEEFDRQLGIQDGAWCDGEDKICVEESTKIRTIKGHGITNKDVFDLLAQAQPGARASSSAAPPHAQVRHDALAATTDETDATTTTAAPRRTPFARTPTTTAIAITTAATATATATTTTWTWAADRPLMTGPGHDP